MTGSDNACYVNANKGLSGFGDRIVSPNPQGQGARQRAHVAADVTVCRTCATAFETRDARRRFCSDACRKRAAAASLRRRQAEHRARYPQREICRSTLRNAILLGKVRRCSRCEECGKKAFTEGHHSDYAKPLFVTWLCRPCHALLDGGAHFGCGQFKAHASQSEPGHLIKKGQTV